MLTVRMLLIEPIAPFGECVDMTARTFFVSEKQMKIFFTNATIPRA